MRCSVVAPSALGESNGEANGGAGLDLVFFYLDFMNLWYEPVVRWIGSFGYNQNRTEIEYLWFPLLKRTDRFLFSENRT